MFVQTKIDILARLVGIASTEATRPYLQGVHVRALHDRAGVIVEATNGHICALEYDDAGRIESDGKSVIVSTIAIKAIAATAKTLAKAWKVAPTDLTVVVYANGYRLQCGKALSDMVTFPPPNVNPFLDFSFPDISRVIPKIPFDAAPVRDCYNANLLHALASSALTTKREGALTICIYSYDIGSPARVKVTGAPNWLGVIMPMRGVVDGPRAPWEAVPAEDMKAAA